MRLRKPRHIESAQSKAESLSCYQTVRYALVSDDEKYITTPHPTIIAACTNATPDDAHRRINPRIIHRFNDWNIYPATNTHIALISRARYLRICQILDDQTPSVMHHLRLESMLERLPDDYGPGTRVPATTKTQRKTTKKWVKDELVEQTPDGYYLTEHGYARIQEAIQSRDDCDMTTSTADRLAQACDELTVGSPVRAEYGTTKHWVQSGWIERTSPGEAALTKHGLDELRQHGFTEAKRR